MKAQNQIESESYFQILTRFDLGCMYNFGKAIKAYYSYCSY